MQSTRENYSSELILNISKLAIESLRGGNKLILCGNGSSASQCQDMTANLINRFKINRKPIECMDLTSNSAVITSIANDLGFQEIFSRQVEAYAKKGDVLIGISTSGNSENIVKAVKKAKELGCCTICLLGKDGGRLKSLCDIHAIAESYDAPKIQEIHLSMIHLICEEIEKNLSDSS